MDSWMTLIFNFVVLLVGCNPVKLINHGLNGFMDDTDFQFRCFVGWL
jgi:hypothetical protein